ncbi:MAG: winged helix-turn-helix domain-containing protein [Alphaproteobacteria bacterium]|nr:winged helix-turn-helix domain-containing protein [Alphaproteobacteria bacterium]MCB9975119.1 winged helix-turn-helix domain-containing protein [Rhodospirillales bacterium]
MQNEKARLWTIIADPGTCDALSVFLQNTDIRLDLSYRQEERPVKSLVAQSEDREVRIDLPVRIGTLIDTLLSAHNKKRGTEIAKEHEHPLFSLNTLRGTLRKKTKNKENETRLTEKETAILSYLLENSTRTVSRKELLTAVWEYAETVETHTLETHIYRLRQKIEKNPSEPKILVTSKNGYKLN